MRERYVVINGSINGKEPTVPTKKNPERKLQTETHTVIGTVRILTNTFQRDKRNVHIPFQTVKRMVIEDFILKHRMLSYFPFMYRFPKRCIVNHDPSSYGQS